MKKLLLIDLDDTLWATKYNNKRSLYELYTALDWGQYFVSFEEYYQMYLPINTTLWDRYNQGLIDKKTLSLERLRLPMRGRLSLSDAEWEHIDEQFLEFVRSQRTLCPNAIPVIQYLKSRYRICILSNGFASVQYSKIELSGLTPYIDQIVLSDEVGIHKPHPDIFLQALKQMGEYSTEECLMIGDSYSSDIVGASNAGIDSVWYNPNMSPIPQKYSNARTPIAIISDLEELKGIL